jgi:hypothetical protein
MNLLNDLSDLIAYACLLLCLAVAFVWFAPEFGLY